MNLKSIAYGVVAFVLVASAQGVYKHYNPEPEAVFVEPPKHFTPPPVLKAPEQVPAQKVPEQEQMPQKGPEAAPQVPEQEHAEEEEMHVEKDESGSFTAPAVRIHADKCTPEINKLIATSPLAAWTEATMKARGKEKFFRVWLDCESMVLSIAIAVHESHHLLSQDAYQLANHTKVPRVEGIRPRPDRLLRKDFPKEDGYADTYLKSGKNAATSHEDFEFILDELNAYAIDTLLSLQLKDHLQFDNSYRDGLAALMMMTMDFVKKVDRTTRGQLLYHRRTMEALWSQAEDHFIQACQVKDFSHNDKFYRDFLFNPANHSGLEEVLGRKLRLPATCTPSAAETLGYQGATN